MKRIIALFIILFWGVGCAPPLASSNVPQKDADMAAKIVREYASWTPLLQSARNINLSLVLLCRTMTAEEQAYTRSDHAKYYVQVYVNPVGAAAIRQEGTRVFPKGTIIVKEKLAEDTRLLKIGTGPKPVGLGIMIKREKNFDPEGGDWEYLYVDEKGTVTRDHKQLEHCRACHSAQTERDAVFFPAVLNE